VEIVIFKRIAVYLIFILTGSLVVLLLMVVVRMSNPGFRPPVLFKTDTPVVTIIPSLTPSPVPSATPTPEPTLTNTPQPTPTTGPTQKPIIEAGCYDVVFVEDVTVPDGTKFNPDKKFTKTWRLQNGGTCTWTPGFTLYFHSGDQMSGPDSQQLTGVTVPPGTLIDVSVVLRSPKEPGTHKSFWAIKDENGYPFGMGRLYKPFYVEIEVIESGSP
jgi:hypothetical protein